MRTRALFIFMVVALTALISSMAWAQVTLPITETFDESWTAATSGFTLTTGTWTCSSTVPTRNTTATYNYSSSTAGCKLSSAGVYLVTPQLSGGIGTVTFYQSSGGTSSRYISVYKSTDGTTYSFVQKCSTSAAAATLMTVAVNDVNAKYLKFNDSTSSVYIDQITIAAWTAPTVTTDAVNSYAQTTASIGATISSLGLTSITSYGVCYSSSSATPTISDTKIETGTSFTATGSYTSSITGLKPSTTYYVRAYATNTQGTSYGSALSFTTSAATYTNYYNVSGSDVSVLTNWGTNTDGTGTNPSNFTTDFQLFNITNSGATLGSAWIVSGSASKVIIGDGTNAASLIIPSSYALTGTVDVTASGTLTVQNATAPTLGTLNASSTVVFDGIAAVAGSYGNLTLANAATLPSGTVTIAGTFTPGTTTSASSGIVAFNGSSTQTIPAFTYSSLTASNDATIAAGTTVAVNNALTVATSKTLTVNGTLQSTYTGSTTPFTISGTLVFGSTGVYDLAAAATTTAVYIPTATWNAGSTAKITGIVGVATTDYTLLNGVSQSFSNFTINAPSLLGKIVLQQVSAFGSASGTFTVTSTGTGSLQTSYSSAANSGLTVANYVQAAGTVYIVNNSSSTVNRSVTVSGAFTLNGGTFIIAQYKATTTGKSSLLIGGNLTIASGATLSKDITTYGDYGTAFVSLNGTTAQTITILPV
jgi:hypothetical protein